MIDAMTWKEKIVMWVAWKLPRRLVYWCTVRLIAEASRSDNFMDEVPDFKAMDALELWEYPEAEIGVF